MENLHKNGVKKMLIFLFSKVKTSMELNEFLRENLHENLSYVYEHVISKLYPYILDDEITFRCAELTKQSSLSKLQLLEPQSFGI